MLAYTDIFFDLDHTLWDFERNSALAFEAVLAANGIPVEIQAFLSHYVPINHSYWERYRHDRISQETLRHGRLKDTFDALDIAIDEATIGIISDGYIEELPRRAYLFDGAIDVLDYLSRKYRLHIITNGFAGVQERKIATALIGGYFATVTDSETAGFKKPHPGIFTYALNRAGASAGSSLMVGDCIDADVKGALNAGMDAILFHEDANPLGFRQIRHLTELKNLL
jgi:putative hydrolase of the HAD superfamily